MSYVMMAIPAELVPAVSEFLENLGDSPAHAAGQPRPGRAEDGFVHGWDRETVQRAYRESADKLRSLLEFLADNAEREITSYELADAIEAEFGWNTVAGMLGAFGRRSANRYRRPMPMWDYRYDDDGRILMTMPPGPAKAIREARTAIKK